MYTDAKSFLGKIVKVKIIYEEPEEPLLKSKNEFDLLIITISDFSNPLPFYQTAG